MVARLGFEPKTLWLKVKCSTYWANEPSMAASAGFEPAECQSQSLMPYHLATRQYEWWGDMDLNHITRRNRFLYYYSFHYHFHVCSLDFLLTISFDLGSSYKVSTLKDFPLARDWHIYKYLAFPELATSTITISSYRCNLDLKSIKDHSLPRLATSLSPHN